MRRGRILIFVVLILIIGLVVAAVAIRQFLLQANQPPQPAFVDVYVVGPSIIPQGGAITESVLTTVSLPQDKVMKVMYTRDELAALTTNKVAKYPLDPGVFITEAMISDKSSAVSIAGPQWAALIPAGMTAISIPMNRLSAVAYGATDGAHVNINACFLFVDVDPTFQTMLPNLTAQLTGTGVGPNALPVLSLGVGAAGSPQGRLELEPAVQQPYYIIPSEKQQRPRMVCQTLLQNVTIMKLGSFPLNTTTTTTQPAATDQTAQSATPPIPDIVTLIVSPQDSVTLSYIVYTDAQIMMTLRNPSDDARQATEASTLQFLLSQYNIPVPAKLPYAMEPPILSLTAPIPNVTTVSPSP